MHVVRKIASLVLTGVIGTLLAACGSDNTTNSGQSPAVTTFTCVNGSPTAPCTITGLSATFNAVATDPDGSAPAYSWSFGDGGTDTVSEPTHLYVFPGTYTVTLVVAGEGNTVTRTLVVTIIGGTSSTPISLENWTWVNGPSPQNANSFGTYETEIVPSPLNVPSSRQSAASWTDSQGRLWMFGGSGFDSTGTAGTLNDLWRFDPSLGTNGEWTWVNGSNGVSSVGSYGTQGTPAAINMPSARAGAAAWTDATPTTGKFWLFGGAGYDSAGTYGYLNDVWSMNPQTGAATWMSGSNISGQVPSYGTQGTPSCSNTPGGRANATTWVTKNSAGKTVLWLFGGITDNAAGAQVTLNDLWKFDPTVTVTCPVPAVAATATTPASPATTATIVGEWTWVGGSSAENNAAGVYGTQNVGATTNFPGARLSAQGWTDAMGNLWLFGGSGYDSTDAAGMLNDMWSYNPTSGIWTWVSGSNVVGGAESGYLTENTPLAGTTPSARMASVGWTDAAGTLWLFGGGGFSDTGLDTASDNELADIWSFSPITGQWLWMGGTTTVDTAGVYAAQGTASNLTLPGARMWSTAWTVNGNMWLFGGVGADVLTAIGNLNDLWYFQPPASGTKNP